MVHQRIQELARQIYGLESERAIRKLLGIANGSWYNYIKHDFQNVPVSKAIEVAKKLNTSVEALFSSPNLENDKF